MDTMASFKKILASLDIIPQQVAEVLKKMPPGFKSGLKLFAVIPTNCFPPTAGFFSVAPLPDTGYHLILFQGSDTSIKENLVLPGGAHYPVVSIEEFLKQAAT